VRHRWDDQLRAGVVDDVDYWSEHEARDGEGRGDHHDRDDAPTADLTYDASNGVTSQAPTIRGCPSIDRRSTYKKGHEATGATYRVDLRSDDSYTIRVELAPIRGTTGESRYLSAFSDTSQRCVEDGPRDTPGAPGVVSPPIVFDFSGQAQRNANDGSLVLNDSKTEPITNGERKMAWNIKIN
jgi:hypothetical protein